MKRGKVVCTIEARMTSSRLPGKVLMEVCGKPLLQHMIERIRRSTVIDDVVVATTINIEDDPIVNLCKKVGCSFFRGSEEDVLLRVLETVKSVDGDIVVETTGDCPCIDWRHIDYLVNLYKSSDYDYVANNTILTFPDGFDVRIFSTKMLDDLNSKSKDPKDHEHVSIYFPRHPQEYKCYNWEATGKEYRPELAVTLDEIGDFKLIEAVYNGLFNDRPDFSCSDVIDYLDAHKEVVSYIDEIKRTVV